MVRYLMCVCPLILAFCSHQCQEPQTACIPDSDVKNFQVMMFVTVISVFSVTFRSFKFTMEMNCLWMIQTLTMVNICIAN